MSGASAWRLLRLDEDGVSLESTRRQGALEFADALLPSKAVVRKVFEREQLSRAGLALRRQDLLEAGDELRLAFARPQKPACTEDMGDGSQEESRGRARSSASDAGAIVLLYQDRLLLAVDKPAGILVHGDGTGAETLTHRVTAFLATTGVCAEPQAVQRLDVETTGVVLFSLTEEFQPALDAQVSGHDMRKRYLAVVEGHLRGADGAWLTLDGPIARDRHDARKMRVGRSGKPACTRVRVVDECRGLTLLLVELESGRRHQIRVHLSAAGHPIVGDVLYGGRRCSDGLLLHCWEERLVHPLTKEPLTLRAPIPPRYLSRFPEAGSHLA